MSYTLKLFLAGLLTLPMLFGAVRTARAEPNYRLISQEATMRFFETYGCHDYMTTLHVVYATPPAAPTTGTTFEGSHKVTSTCPGEEGTIAFVTWNGTLPINPIRTNWFGASVKIRGRDQLRNTDLDLIVASTWTPTQSEDTCCYQYNLGDDRVGTSMPAQVTIGILSENDIVNPYFAVATGTIRSQSLRVR